MRGLTDAHWHMVFAPNTIANMEAADTGLMYANAVAEAERTLMRGFTTIRDTGGPTFGLKQAIDTGAIPGPRVYPSGALISQSDPIDTLQYTPEEIRAAVQAATDWGTYVCAHVYTVPGIRRAIAAGVRSIEHGHMADEATIELMAKRDVWLSIQPSGPTCSSSPRGRRTSRSC